MIIDEVNYAREVFEIKDFPGNLFEYIVSKENYIKKYNFLLFKQELSNISGFIGYSKSNKAIICINYNRNIGHQNFTLAHEIGHLFLHKGQAQCDQDKDLNITNKNDIESEANEFAAELIYPKNFVLNDYEYIIKNNLLDSCNYEQLGSFLNEICKKYFVSFKFAFCRILYTSDWHLENRVNKKWNDFYKYIKPISERFDKSFYSVDINCEFYKPYVAPYESMKFYVHELVKRKDISIETGEALIYKHGLVEGCK